MLIGIPALIGPEMLAALCAMGHGEEVAIVDGNYPALGHAQRLVRADGHGLAAVLEAVLQVFPLDEAPQEAVLRVGWGNDPSMTADIHREVDALVERLRPGQRVAALPGPEFYARVRAAHLVIATSEPALYGNVILRKGVIAPTSPPVIRSSA